jgi:hypothetical protein
LQGISFGNQETSEKFVREGGKEKVIVKSHMVGDHLGKMCKQLWDNHEDQVRSNLDLSERDFKALFCGAKMMKVCDDVHQPLIDRDEL